MTRVENGTRPEPLLEVGDIQGNILAGFNKDHQTLVALAIHDVASARAWLRRIEPEIASVTEVLRFNNLFRALRARRGEDPRGLVATWANIALSAPGLAKLSSQAEVARLPDTAFQAGMYNRAGLLHDPTRPGTPGTPDTWVVGRRDRIVDILLIVASDDPSHLADAVARLLPRAGDSVAGGQPPEVIWREQGDVRPDAPGHEHFGYKDSISQPAVRGLVSRNPDVFLARRRYDPSDPLAGRFAAPGQLLVWPGNFVLGYPKQVLQNNQVTIIDPPDPLDPAWMKNGSFLVFRRLAQDVEGFRDFVRTQAANLKTKPGFEAMDPDRLGAMMIGRWRSGAPLLRALQADNPALADDDAANNDFFYRRDSTAPKLLPDAPVPGQFPIAQADPDGAGCPFSSHLRKVNPRDGLTDLGNEPDTPSRRILRRGIPYGPSLPDPVPDSDTAERGLHFLCYQASIADQFETLMRNWANNPTVPPGSLGQDPIIGQKLNEGVPDARTFGLKSPDGQQTATLTLPRQFVTTTGGGYFFAPSLSALRGRLGQPTPSPSPGSH